MTITRMSGVPISGQAMMLIEIADGAKNYDDAINSIVDAFRHERWTKSDARRNLAAARAADWAANDDMKVTP